jgi:hypothetical protein
MLNICLSEGAIDIPSRVGVDSIAEKAHVVRDFSDVDLVLAIKLWKLAPGLNTINGLWLGEVRLEGLLVVATERWGRRSGDVVGRHDDRDEFRLGCGCDLCVFVDSLVLVAGCDCVRGLEQTKQNAGCMRDVHPFMCVVL